MKIIGIIGNKGVGKDTLGEYLVSKYNYTRYGFGDPVKNICKILFDLDEEQLYGNKKDIIDNRYGITPRIMFQRIGTDFGQYKLLELFPELRYKKIPKNIWVNLFESYLEKNREKKIVITDVRFIHEVKFLKKHSAILIKLDKDNIQQDSHISEKELESINNKYIDICFQNNGSKDDLFNKWDDFITPF
jgi:dephospho-CoA kinase